MIDRLLKTLAPHSCCGCGYYGQLLCDFCKYNIIAEPFARCIVCLQPTGRDDLCRTCRSPTTFEGGWCVGARQDSLKALLDRFKFDAVREAGSVAAELLDERLPVLSGVTVVPVPTSPAHRRSRGFDHTLLVARRFCRSRGLDLSKALARDNTSTQHFLGRSERLKAAREGLRVRTPVPERVLLLDDIYTTGATLRACVDILRENGAKTVFVAVIARQTLDEGDDLW